MAWNDPGNGNGRDPWNNSGNGNSNGPPDLDEVMRKLQQRLNRLFGSKVPSGGGGTSAGGGLPTVAWLGLAAVLFVAAAIYDGFFVIESAERGVVTRFGAYQRTEQPGLHFKLPFVESTTTLNVDSNRSVSTGTQSVLTRDENVVVIDLTVQYNIKEAEKFLFEVRNPEQSLRQVAESAIREVIGDERMDYVIQEGREAIATNTGTIVQQVLDDYGTGIIVNSVNLERAQPPEPVQASFDDAARSREDKERLINEAEAYANGIIPQARGDARRLIEEAKAYRTEAVRGAEGETARFSQLLVQYEIAPEITRDRLYLETMESVMANSSKILLDSEGNSPMMYLPLEKLMSGQGAAATALPSAVQGGSASQSRPATSPLQRFDTQDNSRSRSRGN